MLQQIDVVSRDPRTFEDVIGRQKLEELIALAAPLRGLRVLHLNATPYGGGVSELLRSQVPLLLGLGIQAEWRVIAADTPFFKVTKDFHNALQGAELDLADEAKEIYLSHNERNAELLDSDYDVIVVHDPQPAAVRHLTPKKARRWVWRCHIDTAQPNRAAWEFLRPFVEEYDGIVFTMREFVPPGLEDERVSVMAPAIDPLSPKNMPLPHDLARRLMEWVGVEPDRPLLTQVSRFDPWKDPVGVIRVYRLAREQVPDLQLALLGSMALDDPESWDIYQTILEESKNDRDVHVFTNLTGVSNMEVNAFQTHSDVVIQKSIREGFGLIISETLWKGTPVVAHKSGGIPMQVPPESAELLVDSEEGMAERIVRLLRSPDDQVAHGRRGQQWVSERFLLPRLVADDLRLIRQII